MSADLNAIPIADEALGNTSYLVPAGEGLAFSVDPRRDIDEHIAIAARLGLSITAVFETHLHADFVSGSLELRHAVGADVHAATEARLAFPHVAVGTGDRLHIGNSVIEVLATRGHTPEHVSYRATIGRQTAVFSGGSLIVGGAARTDLTDPARTEELSRAQYASLRALAALPDDTLLYPTHGGGSFCSATRARSATSTIGDERASNPLLAIEDEAAFVEALRASSGSYPTYFNHLRDVNRAGPRLLTELTPPHRASAADALRESEMGAWIVDARPYDRWAAEHPTGSVSIATRPAFASWLGWVVPFGERVVLVLEEDQVDEALRLARRIGYDTIGSWIGFEVWRRAGYPVSSVDTVDPAEARDRSRAGSTLLDVRQSAEHAASRLPGAEHLELGDIIAGKMPDAADVITYCGHGERSATAASLLSRRGVRVANLAGGVASWRRAGLPLER